MNVKYDKFNDLFFVDGKEVFWSSIYVLRQKESTLAKLKKQLKVDKSEEALFSEELDDLRDLGFITGKNKIKTTKKGLEFLHEIEKHIKFSQLREKAIKDIDDVAIEANEAMRAKKTKLLVKHNWKPEVVEWFSLFLNTAMGFCALFFVVLLFFFGVGELSLNALIVQAVFAPIGSIMLLGSLTVFMWVLYHGGMAIGYFLFRRD